MDKFTPAEARLLVQARTLLVTRMRAAADHVRDGDHFNAFNLGKAHEAHDAASDAIFNVLNTAKSFLDDDVAGLYLHEKIPMVEVVDTDGT